MLHTYIQWARPKTYVSRFEKRWLRAELSYGTGVSRYFQCQTQLELLFVRDLTKQELQRRELPALASAFSSQRFSFSVLWLQPQIPLAAASSSRSDSIALICPLVYSMYLTGIPRFRQSARPSSPISSKRRKVHHPMLMHLSFSTIISVIQPSTQLYLMCCEDMQLPTFNGGKSRVRWTR